MECTNDTHLALINSTYKIPTTIKKCDNVVLSKMGPRIIQVGPYPMKWEFENGETTQETSANQKTSEPCLKPLRDSSHLIREYGNEESRKLAQKLLCERFNADGYLFIRGLIDREVVLKARQFLLEDFAKVGGILDPERNLEEGVLLPRCGLGCVPYLEGRNETTNHPLVKEVLENVKLKEFFENYIFGEEVLTFDFKWLRVMPRETFTGVHVDNVYMSRGTKKLVTTWIPFGDVPMEMGTVAVCEGSHRLPGFKKFQDTYAELDTEAEKGFEGSGWFTEDPTEITSNFGGQWRSSDFQAGDVLLFGMRTAHMSTKNMTDKARISCDVRWQPASEPADPRYVGKGKPSKQGGAYASDEKKATTDIVTMSDLRKKWDI